MKQSEIWILILNRSYSLDLEVSGGFFKVSSYVRFGVLTTTGHNNTIIL